MATTTAFPDQQEQQQQQQQQQQQPVVYPQAASGGAWHSSGSIGPFFAVISVIAVLTVLSCVFSRFCVGSNSSSSCRSASPPLDTRYENCFRWVRRRFNWCTSHDIEVGHKVVLGGEQQGNKNGKSQDAAETAAL